MNTIAYLVAYTSPNRYTQGGTPEMHADVFSEYPLPKCDGLYEQQVLLLAAHGRNFENARRKIFNFLKLKDHGQKPLLGTIL